jgi:hypothetical protein
MAGQESAEDSAVPGPWYAKPLMWLISKEGLSFVTIVVVAGYLVYFTTTQIKASFDVLAGSLRDHVTSSDGHYKMSDDERTQAARSRQDLLDLVRELVKQNDVICYNTADDAAKRWYCKNRSVESPRR